MNGANGKKLLVCTVGIPHKSKGASLVLYYHYIEWFKKNGFTMLHVILLSVDYDKKALDEYCNAMADNAFEIHTFEAKRFYNIQHFFPKVIMKNLDTATVKKIETFHPDCLLCFDIVCAGVLSEATKHMTISKKIVWLGDLNFQTYWYHALYDAKESFKNAVRLPAFLVLSVLWRAFYKKLLRRWDFVIVSSKSSEKELEKMGITSTYLPYPWPAGVHAGKYHAQKFKLPTFVFFGTLTGLGSRSAFHFLIQSLYEKLVILFGHGKFEVLICGSRGLPSWVEKKISVMNEIKYLGFVDDLDVLLTRCHAVIVPIDVPVGNRSRIVTAMAAGALIIAHKNTALGNPELVDEKTCYLAADDQDFVRCIRRAHNDTEHTARIVKQAMESYHMTFRPDVAGQMLVSKIL